VLFPFSVWLLFFSASLFQLRIRGSVGIMALFLPMFLPKERPFWLAWVDSILPLPEITKLVGRLSGLDWLGKGVFLFLYAETECPCLCSRAGVMVVPGDRFELGCDCWTIEHCWTMGSMLLTLDGLRVTRSVLGLCLLTCSYELRLLCMGFQVYPLHYHLSVSIFLSI
jgi:hypothetical protein